MIADDWKSKTFKDFVADWGRTARTSQALRKMKIAIMGQMPWMGDILTDSAAFMRRIGPQVGNETSCRLTARACS